jgi:hypothetical protein
MPVTSAVKTVVNKMPAEFAPLV